MRDVRLASLLLALCLCSPATAIAQAPAAQPESVPAPEPEVRHLPEVLGQEISVRLELQKLGQTALPSKEIESIEAARSELDADVQDDAPAALEQLGGALRLRQLDETENEWLRHRARLESWHTTLAARAVDLHGDLERLDELAEPLEWAREEAASLGAPASVQTTVGDLLKSIRATRSRVEARWSEVIGLDSRLVETLTVVVEVTSLAQERRQSLQGVLLSAGRLPLWRVFESDRPPSLVALVGENLGRLWRPARNWARDEPGSVLFQIVLFGALILLAAALRPAARAWSAQDESVRPTERMLGRPVAISTLLTLSTIPLLYADAPQGLRYFGGLGIMLALLRLVSILLRGAPLVAFYSVAAVYLAERLRELLQGDPVIERLVGALEMAVLVGVLSWLLRPLHRAELPGGPRARRLVSAGLLAYLALSGAGLVSSVAGFADLAELLGEGVLRSSLTGVVLFAGYKVLSGLSSVALRTEAMQRLNMVRRYHPIIRQRLRTTWRFVAISTFVYLSLDFFELWAAVADTTGGWLIQEFHLGQLTISPADLLLVGFTFGAAVLLSRLVRTTLEEDVVSRLNLPRGVPQTISVTAGYVVLLIGAIIALAAGGFDTSRLALVAGALSVGIGFGLQNVVNNFVSGLILIFERPIQVGDTIELDTLIGEVRSIGVRASMVRTFQGAEVIVPNGDLISQRVTNWTLSDRRRRIELPVGVAYGSDPKQVIELLIGVARGDEDIVDDPEPAALFRGFGDSSLDFELRAWTGAFDGWMAVASRLGVGVHDALGEAGITIPFPQRDVHLISEATDAPDKEPSDG